MSKSSSSKYKSTQVVPEIALPVETNDGGDGDDDDDEVIEPSTPRYARPPIQLKERDENTGVEAPPDNWWATLFVWEGTVLSEIVWRLCIVLSLNVALVVLSMVADIKIPTFTTVPHTLIGLPLGLLLVFRTNSAYDRFWEGRKAWGTIIIVARNFSRYVGTFSLRMRSGDMFPNVFAAYTIALKHRLRGTSGSRKEFADLEAALLPSTLAMVLKVNNRAAACLRLLNEFLYDKSTDGEIADTLLSVLQGHLLELTQVQSACERIINTPMPLPYLIQIRQLVFIYCMTLPVILITLFDGVASLLATFMISFGLIGIEEAGKIIENPFGLDDSDLPIESFIELLEMDMAQTIAFARHAYRLTGQRQVSRGEPLLPPVDGRFRAEKLADLDLDDTLDSEIDELKRISEAFGNVAPGADPVGIHGLRAKAGVGGVVQAPHSAQMAELIRAEMAMQQRR